MLTLALLVIALIFGGMVLYCFGFATFLFTALPASVAVPTIRRAFPHFHLLVMLCAAIAARLTWPYDPFAAGLLALIAVTTVPARQMLKHAISRATDAGAKTRFEWLHELSVAITLAHIELVGVQSYPRRQYSNR